MEPILKPYRQKNKWGFINENLEVVIPFNYEKVKPFSEEAAAVRNENWTFLTKFNEPLNSMGYYELNDFSCCRASFRGKSKISFGFLNEQGKEIISEQFDRVFPFKHNFAFVSKNLKWGVIDKDGDFLIRCIHEGIIHHPSQTIKWYNTFPSWEEVKFLTANSDFEMFYKSEILKVSEDILHGKIESNNYLIDEFGNLKTQYFDFDYGGKFHFGRALIKRNNTVGFVDVTGELVIPNIYKEGSDFQEGFALVKDNNELYGYIDITGNLITDFKYKHAERFKNGFAEVKSENGVWGYIDKQGKELWEE
ncbi:MAG: WG repeat-containing protein [Bacteroidota bacterium]|nr:WG repeat-containing protein [Bacteroidota bacterium]